MKITIEASDKDFQKAIAEGWNERFEEELEGTDIMLPDIGDLDSGEPNAIDITLALPFLFEDSNFIMKRIS